MSSELVDCLCDVLPENVISSSLERVMKVSHKDSSAEVGIGTILTPSQVLTPPEITFPAEANTYYTVIKTDPDAPTRSNPLFREFLHWGVVNVTDGESGNILSGDQAVELCSYVPAGAPCNSGLHRYIYLLYKQDGGLLTPQQIETLKIIFQARGGQKSHENVTPLGMTLIGAAAYKAEWDVSVDAIHESLGFMPPEEYQSPSQKEKTITGK